MSIAHLPAAELADRPLRDAIATRGRELSVDDTVGAARALLASSRVQLIPVLAGREYAGAVGAADLEGAPAEARLGTVASAAHPTASASDAVAAAVARLRASGGLRLVVLDDDGSTFVGMLCLRSDREHLCVDDECRAAAAPPAGADLVADLVLAEPGRARVFERLGIDYCCGGRVPLADACAARGLELGDVLAELAEPRSGGADEVDWRGREIGELVDHIVATHHAYLREELEPLGALAAKVARAHGAAHPELLDVETTFARVASELHEHMPKEELVVFPACVRAAEDPRRPDLAEAIAALEDDHDAVGAGLARLRELTAGYAPPPDACTSYRALLDRLQMLESDTHRHIHEESNVLFPRVLEAARA